MMHDVLVGVTMYLLIAVSVFFTCLRDHTENPAMHPDYTTLQVLILSLIWPLSGVILALMEVRRLYQMWRISRCNERKDRYNTYRLLQELRDERSRN